jgi:hypothetical protein
MRPLTAILSLALLLAIGRPALAVKILVRINASNISESGFKVSVKQSNDGLLVWTIERDLAKARSFPADSELTIGRRATVTLYDEQGVAAVFPLESEPSADKHVLTYWFKTSRAMAADAHLTVSEIDEYKDPNRGPLLGGGTYFELPLHSLVTLPAASTDKR